MRVVTVRQTSPDEGLVALLVEEGGPSMLAIPVSAREGLMLSGEAGTGDTWPFVLASALTTCGFRLIALDIDIDDDAALRCSLRVTSAVSGGEEQQRSVACSCGDGLIAASVCGIPVVASAAALRLRGIDLTEESISAKVVAWRADIAAATAVSGEGDGVCADSVVTSLAIDTDGDDGQALR